MEDIAAVKSRRKEQGKGIPLGRLIKRLAKNG